MPGGRPPDPPASVVAASAAAVPAADPIVSSGYRLRVIGSNDNAASSTTLSFELRLGPNGTTADTGIILFPPITTQASALTNRGWFIDGWVSFGAIGATGRVWARAQLDESIAAGTSASIANPHPVVSGGFAGAGGTSTQTEHSS